MERDLKPWKTITDPKRTSPTVSVSTVFSKSLKSKKASALRLRNCYPQFSLTLLLVRDKYLEEAVVKLRCGREDLVGKVQTVMRAVSAKSTLPTLTGLHLSVEEGKATLCGTDLEMSIRAELPASVEESGKTVVPARFLSEIARSLPDGTVALKASNGNVELECAKSNFNLRSLPSEEFPLPKVAEWDGALTFPTGDFCEAMRRVNRAASKDDSRPILTGVALRVRGDRWEAAATDSYRLAVTEGKLSGSDSDVDAVIPARGLDEVTRIAASEGADGIQAVIGENEARFKMGNVELICRLLDGAYPAYQQLFPDEFSVEAQCERESFLSAAKRASIVADGSPLQLELRGGLMQLCAKNQEVGEVSEEMEVTQSGEDLSISFNAQYLIEGLTAIPGPKVRLLLNSAVKPGLLKPVKDETFRYLIMPVRAS